MTFARRIALGAILAALVPLFFALLIFLNFRANVAQTRIVAKARQALTLTTDFHRLVVEMERAIRGFRITGDEKYLQPYREAVLQYEPTRRELAGLLAGRPEGPLLSEIDLRFEIWRDTWVEPRIEHLRRVPPRRTAEGTLLSKLPEELEIERGKRAMDEFRRRFEELEKGVRAWNATALRERDEATARLSTLLWSVAIAFSLLLLAGAGWLTRLYRRRAGILFAGLEAAEKGAYEPVALSGRDEPARIAEAFNKSLAEIRRRDEKLRRAEAFLGSVIENLPITVFVKDARDLRFLRFNRAGERLTGRSREELLGKNDSDFLPKEQAAVFLARDREALAKGDLLDIPEEPMQTKAGETRLLHTRRIPIRDEETGEPLYLLGISEDITDLKRAEEEANRFFTLALEMLCIADFNGYFTRMNPAWERTLGFSTAELSSRPFLDFVHPDDRAATLAEAEKLGAQEHETVSFVNRYRCADGSYKWLLWNCKSDPVRRLIYAAARDITEEKLAEEQIQQLNRELARRVEELHSLNQELEAFSYSVSHDLRAPLRHVVGFSDLLERRAGSSLDEKGRRYLRTIASAARKMGRLIDDLLVFSRMGRSEMRETRVNLAALARDVQRECEAEGREIVWKWNGLPEVQGDPAMLRQVFVNLMSNAVKYTGTRARAEIEIGSYQDGEEDVIFVRDNGIGFDMQYAHNLFGVFQRLHRAEDFEGTGIGLANVRRVVHRHGGRTWAEGEPDRGATFYISLPREGRKES